MNPNPQAKGEALARFLEDRGVRFNRTRMGWQKVSCMNDAAHPRGDRNPSASINLSLGKYRCFACDLHGDVIDLIQEEKSLTYSEALSTLGIDKALESAEETETWL